MIQEKIEHLFIRPHLKYSIPVILTIISIYFWITFFNNGLLYIIGVAINITGFVTWWVAKVTLDKNWGVGFGKPQIKQLVTRGIYSKLCHPMYWGINLTLIGLVLLYPEFWFLILSILIIVYFFYRMRAEDKYLLEKLGEEYRNYKRKTWI